MKKAKKQRIVYKENNAGSKAAELEEFLFGVRGDATSIFEREAEQCEETVAELINKQAKELGSALRDTDLFFEDTRGRAGISDDDRDDDDDDGGMKSTRGEKGRKGAKRGASSSSSSSSSEDDDEDDDAKRVGPGSGAVGTAADDSDGEAKGKIEQQGKTEFGGISDTDAEGEGEEGDGDGFAARARSSQGAGTAGRDQQEEEETPANRAVGKQQQGQGQKQKEQQKQKHRGEAPSGPGRPGGGASDGDGGPAAVWSDPHDATVVVNVAKAARLRKLRTSAKQMAMRGAEYEAALRKQHRALNPRTRWATKSSAAAGGSADGSDNEEEGEEDAEGAGLLARAGGLVERPAGRRLPAGQIEMTRLKDANQHQPSDAVVRAVRFHPNGQVLLTAGLDKKLRLFQVDGLRNPLMQSLHLEDLPITDAAFAAVAESGSDADGGAAAAAADRVVLSGRRSFFYVFDLGAARVERVLGPSGCSLKSLETFTVTPPSSRSVSSEPLVAFAGDGGFIPLVSLRTRQWVANLKMSGNVRALAFTPDGRELLSSGDDGVVHVWDLRTRRCRLALLDAGNIGDASSLALSADQRYLATGSRSGVVNVYKWAEVEEAAARAASGGGGRVAVPPARELLNLTTNVDTLAFSPDSQMLAMASRMKRDALRLVHLPSLTVFANWPTSGTPLHYVHSLDFSPHCGLMSIGNAKGRALLYRLHHYQQA